MLFLAKLVRKHSRQRVGAPQLRTTPLYVDAAGNMDNVGSQIRSLQLTIIMGGKEKFNKDPLDALKYTEEAQ